MKRRTFLIVVLLLCSVQTALAGGWATAKLDALPSSIEANKPVEIGFMLLQHGQTPFKDGSPLVEIRTADSDWKQFSSEPVGAVGHYVAKVTFPSAGTWQMRVNPRPFPLMEDTAITQISVVSAAKASEPSQPSVAIIPEASSTNSGLWIGIASIPVIAVIIALILGVRGQSQSAQIDR